MTSSSRTVAPLSNRERVLRLVKKIIELPQISESPFYPMLSLYRPKLNETLRNMNESEAKAIVDGLRDMLG